MHAHAADQQLDPRLAAKEKKRADKANRTSGAAGSASGRRAADASAGDGGDRANRTSDAASSASERQATDASAASSASKRQATDASAGDSDRNLYRWPLKWRATDASAVRYLPSDEDSDLLGE